MKIKQLLTASFAAMALVNVSPAASILEPSTVFYGKVIGVGDAQPFQLQEGILVWTIQQSDGSEAVFETELYSLNNGEYSYRLDIPHSAVAFELETSDSSIPLLPVSATNLHVSAFVDGLPVEFIGPSGEAFMLGQLTRAQSYQLDMTINKHAVDSDGDGMPDWWEDLMGLDKQDANDGLLDSDGDGLNSLAEYRAGLNPSVDNRIPSLLSKEQLAYVDCSTVVRLKTADLDSAPENIFYTLTDLPDLGVLKLRNATENPESPDVDLVVGSQFTQKQVSQGALIFVQEGEASVNSNTEFSVSVTDENNIQSIDSETVSIRFYEPPENGLLSELDRTRQGAFVAGLLGSVVLDAATELVGMEGSTPSTDLTETEYVENYLPKYGAEKKYFILGGRSDDILSGGMADDVIVGGRGNDLISGGGGSDLFLFNEKDLGASRITDFTPEEGDTLDFSALLAGASGLVDDYVLFEAEGTDTKVKIGANYDDLVVTLEGVQFDLDSAYQLILDGRVAVGNLKLRPRVTVVASDASASENSGNSGIFTFEREGDWSQELTVNVVMGGTALNGSDYSPLPLTVNFAAGEQRVDVLVKPFADNVVEADEIVEVVLVDQADYLIGSESRATILIKDLQAVVGIEVLEGLATTDPVVPGVVLVTRNGQTANSLFVRLNINGSASNGSDYQYVASYVSFAPGQTVIPLEIIPSVNAQLDGGAEVVIVEVEGDTSYALADSASGRLTIVGQRDSLAQWQTRQFPGSSETLLDFAQGDSGNAGIDNLLRYAYGMDPHDPDQLDLPKIVFRNGRMTVDVHRNPEATDVQFIVEVSRDLINWESGSTMVRKVVMPEYQFAADLETYEVVPLVEVENNFFVRVRVEYTR